jgi:hypothetical protein
VSGEMGVWADVQIPEFIPVGNATKMRVFLSSNQTERSVRVTAIAGEEKETKQITLIGNKSVEFLLNLTDTIGNVTVVVESADFVKQFVKPVTVYRIPNLNITNLLFTAENGMVRTSFILSGVQDAKDVAVAVDGERVLLTQAGAVSLLLTPGAHTVEVEFTDWAGNGYKQSYIIDVPAIPTVGNETGLNLEQLLEVIPALLYVTLLILLSAAVLVFKSVEKLQ